ncbi:pilus assembly protein [Actinomadura barringtoniae]|uniref:Pilus assembly protein n=1 Tax=Actinomadura barringtoniae TaxID=1427535 RepID=A0A939PVF0_9ACTN|nr:TadE family type IV pilus minor pilin [Actinomadura barringtoniae]MBO2455521.1 pilus assembly protein [Actinomadura barringtoniae]
MKGRGDRGSATAEIAVALPGLVLIMVAALWGVMVASVQLACTDAARSGARAAARGESLATVREVVAHAVPSGAKVQASRDAETAEVVVTVQVNAPGPSGLPPITVSAHAAAATEPGAADAGPSG